MPVLYVHVQLVYLKICDGNHYKSNTMEFLDHYTCIIPYVTLSIPHRKAVTKNHVNLKVSH